MDREEARARVMAKMPKLTDQQARMHALDRAIQPDIVQTIAAGLADPENMHHAAPERVMAAILGTAAAFAEWLQEDPDVVEGEPEANLGLATTRELLHEVVVRLNTTGTPEYGFELGTFADKLDARELNYRTMDHA